MKFSCVLFYALAFVSCIFVSPLKKTSSRFLFYFFLFCIPCIQFFANLPVNSFQILVRSYLSSELRWQVFSLWWTRSHRSVAFGPTEFFRCNRSTQLGATDFTTGKRACHLFLHSFLIQLHSMILVLYQHHIQLAALFCDSTTKPIRDTNPEEPFLEIDVKGGERDHIKA